MVTALLVSTATGLLGPFLILRRVALLSDAVSHAILPGIVVVFLLFGSRAPLPVLIGAAAVAMICVLGVEAIQRSGLVRSDAAIGLVFPVLFAIGVLGITLFAENVHLDLDATIYGEIAFTPFRSLEIFGIEVARSIVYLGVVAACNLALVVALWKELKLTTLDPEFAQVNGFAPKLVARVLLAAVAITAVTAFESVGAILVVALLIVPAAAAYLLTDRLLSLVMLSVAIGWISAFVGQQAAIALDASIAGAMGVVATMIFGVACVARVLLGRSTMSPIADSAREVGPLARSTARPLGEGDGAG